MLWYVNLCELFLYKPVMTEREKRGGERERERERDRERETDRDREEALDMIGNTTCEKACSVLKGQH
jgi:hypothetical protein